jgi:HNH endonuclease
LDHIVPESQGGPTEVGNLALCCYGCQFQKLAFEVGLDSVTKKSTPIFHPRRQRWSRHFQWSNDALQIEGLTRVGRATVLRLDLNNARQIEARKRWRAHPDLFP